MQFYKKEPYPFEKIAIAVTFSPFLEGLVSEAFRLGQLFEAELHFIHVGKPDPVNENRLNQLILFHSKELSSPTVTVQFLAGEDVVETLLSACKEKEADLLITGGLTKESILKYYIGSVSRMVCRKAKCSVLVIKEPGKTPKPFEHIVVNCVENDKTIPSIQTALYIAEKEKQEHIDVVFEDSFKNISNLLNSTATEDEKEQTSQNLYEEAQTRMSAILSNVKSNDTVKIASHIVSGKPGLGVSNFAREIHADLLVVNSPDSQLGLLDRIFPHGLEYSLENLPSNLMIVHSRPNE